VYHSNKIHDGFLVSGTEQIERHWQIRKDVLRDEEAVFKYALRALLDGDYKLMMVPAKPGGRLRKTYVRFLICITNAKAAEGNLEKKVTCDMSILSLQRERSPL
jgi:hypothetical protein